MYNGGYSHDVRKKVCYSGGRVLDCIVHDIIWGAIVACTGSLSLQPLKPPHFMDEKLFFWYSCVCN